MPSSQLKKTKRIPRVAITMGDAAGIGPEIILKSLIKSEIRKQAKFSIIGDYCVMAMVADMLKVSITNLFENKNLDPSLKRNGKVYPLGLEFINVGKIPEKNFRFGRLNPASGKAAIEYVKKAVELIKDEEVDVLVTAPVNKQAINKGGFEFFGHTEYLAHLTKTKNFAMMLVGGPLKVVPLTRHLPLRKIVRYITTSGIYQAVKLANRCLREYFNIKEPRIGICSLNPHGGEEGVFGDEEERLIKPAIRKLIKEGLAVCGPLPADTLFYQAYKGKYDLVLSMYHDQGLVPLKMIAFNCGVNVTLGLPFIRSSPDHGTAFDIAGFGRADPQSMVEAIKLAVWMWQKRS